MTEIETKSGFVALIGRPNAGKSTLLNRLIGFKVAAVSDKPQTTRTRIRGILTRPAGQIVFFDTPGIHKPTHRMNERMMRAVREVLGDADLLLLIVDVLQPFGGGDEFTLNLIRQTERPALLWLNKVDKLKGKEKLLPLIDRYQREIPFKEIIPGSALEGENTDLLTEKLFSFLPPGPLYYPDTEITDQPERVLAAEVVREKLLMETREEIPYATAVYTERFLDTTEMLHVHCTILVERETQKGIIIGRGGQRLKKIGMKARRELEALLGRNIYLELFVKVRKHWRENARMLDELGI